MSLALLNQPEETVIQVTVEKIVNEPYNNKDRLVWHLAADNGRKFWRRTFVTPASLSIVRDDFRKAGINLAALGVEAAMEAAVGVVLLITTQGEVKIIGKG